MRTGALVLAAIFLFGTSCDDVTVDVNGEPEAAPTETGAAALEEEIDEECAEVSASEGAAAPVTMMDTFFEPPCLAVSSTQSVALTNAGNQDHNFTIEGTDLSADVEPGEDEETDELGDVVEAGTYRFFCRFHEGQGMVGTITIE
jgi:plastocyanin